MIFYDRSANICYVISDLKPLHKYVFQVQAKNKVGTKKVNIRCEIIKYIDFAITQPLVVAEIL